MLDRYGSSEDPLELAVAAKTLLVERNAAASDFFESALLAARKEYELVPVAPWYAHCRALGEYRNGNPDIAIRSLELPEIDTFCQPASFAVHAMAELAQGNREAANEFLSRAKVAMSHPAYIADRWHYRYISELLIEEARELLGEAIDPEG